MGLNVCEVELDGCIVATKDARTKEEVYLFRFITLNMDIVHFKLKATSDKLKGMFVEEELRKMRPYKTYDKLKGDIYMGKNIIIKGVLWVDNNLITVTDVKYLNSDIEL